MRQSPARVVLAAACFKLALLATGCASLPGVGPGHSGVTNSDPCLTTIRAVRETVALAGTGDALAAPVPSFIVLRTNRLLAYLGRRFNGERRPAAFAAWVHRMRRLDGDATAIEIANLPENHARSLGRRVASRGAGRADIVAKYEGCANDQVAVLLKDGETEARLISAARVPDRYSDGARAIGFFPLTSIPVGLGWERWKRETFDKFARPVDSLPVSGSLVDVYPSNRQTSLGARIVARIIAGSRDRLLGIPEPKSQDRARLFAAFAPVWRIDVTGQFDRIGAPFYSRDGLTLGVDTAQPAVYTRISHAVRDGVILLQLNYLAWFGARPKDGPLDLLGGKLDGVIWRVTLGSDGQVLAYDSIHACGCYHLIFPAKASVGARTATKEFRERPAVVGSVPSVGLGDAIVLRLEARTHHLIGFDVVRRSKRPPAGPTYRLAPADTLRSLPVTKRSRRSLYRQDGLVAGTERLERFVLWPMGVRSAGSMRQWGHHAVAFADRRHFDDPDLFERILNW